MVIAVLLGIFLLIVANFVVTIAVAKAIWYTRNQKLAQSLLIWLLPIVGAVVVFVMLRSNREQSSPDRIMFQKQTTSASAALGRTALGTVHEL